jgi:sentrin-specific protease 7
MDPPAVVEEKQAQPSDEEPNLFDEAALSLIDRDDAGFETSHSPEISQAKSVRQDAEAGSLAVPVVNVEAKDTHQGILSQSHLTASTTKTKAKRKSIPKRDPDQPVVIVLDSLTGNARSGAVRALKDWVLAEGAQKRQMEAVIKENGYYPKDTQIPMQENWTDCGVYLLGYIEKFFRNPDDFKNKLLTGSMSAREDWPELKPSEMRHKMRQIIFDCYKKQEEDRKAQKKGKKGSSTSETSPAPTTHEPVDQSRRSTEESRNEETKPGQSPRKESVQSTSPQPPLRLGSPFSLDAQCGASTKQSPQRTVSKVSDSPPVFRSPVKQGILSSQLEETPKRHPEVRIPGRTLQSHESMRNGQTASDGSPRPVKARHQADHTPSIFSPKKRPRQNDDNSQAKSPTAKRQLTGSPRRVDNACVVSEQLVPCSREGSAPNAPIEIDDSQEAKVVSADHGQHVQASSNPPRPKQTLHPSPSVQEISRSSFSIGKSKHGQREGSPVDRALRVWMDEDDYAREKARRASAPAPNDTNDSVERREEEASDPMEGISQSTNQLQLDGVNDGSVVRETPEPDERSPVAHSGWSRQDPLLL